MVAVLLGVLVVVAMVTVAGGASVPPAPVITSSPSDPSYDGVTSFKFKDAVASSFTCSLDGGAYMACGSAGANVEVTKSYPAQAKGDHKFQVKATAGGSTSSYAKFEWKVSEPPKPTITSGPPDPSFVGTAAFTYTNPVAGVSYLCSLDGSAFAACSVVGKSYAGLAKGDHTFKVEAVSPLGTSSYEKYEWDVEEPPAPSIDVHPTDPAYGQSAHFEYSDTAAAVTSITYQCSLDGGPYAACGTGASGSVDYPGPLAKGEHEFKVVAVSPLGTSKYAKFEWKISEPPKPSIDTFPSDPSYVFDASFTYSDAAAAQTTVTYLCSLDDADFTACPDTGIFYPGPLDGGGAGHKFRVKAVSALGTSDYAKFEWKIPPPPPPTIDGHPQKKDPSTTAVFVFSDEVSPVTYMCRLDKKDDGEFEPCASPKIYTGLALGEHKFEVFAIDAIGVPSKVSKLEWKIVANSGEAVTISGDLGGLLYPGGAMRTLPLTLTNTNSVEITVTTLTVALNPATLPPGCTAALLDLNITQPDLSTATPTAGQLVLPAGGSVTLPAQGVAAPKVAMLDKQDTIPGDGTGNQDACAGATIDFLYTSS